MPTRGIAPWRRKLGQIWKSFKDRSDSHGSNLQRISALAALFEPCAGPLPPIGQQSSSHVPELRSPARRPTCRRSPLGVQAVCGKHPAHMPLGTRVCEGLSKFDCIGSMTESPCTGGCNPSKPRSPALRRQNEVCSRNMGRFRSKVGNAPCDFTQLGLRSCHRRAVHSNLV